MSEDKSLEQAITEDLQRTGYPTEIVCASKMQDRQWSVTHNPSYWDSEENQSREYDIRAYKSWTSDSQTATVGVYLIVECKKSERPWVFFTTLEKHNYPRLGRYIKFRSLKYSPFTAIDQEHSIIGDDELRSIHHYFQFNKQARTFYEPLKQLEKAAHSPTIYTAVMSIIKATLFHLRDTPIADTVFPIYYPVIVFSGSLFEAFVNPDKTIDLSPTQYVQLKYSYFQHEPKHSTWSDQQSFTIDIIHEDFLSSFLSTLNMEHEVIANRIGRSITIIS